MKKLVLLSMMAGLMLASCNSNGDDPIVPDSQQDTSGATAAQLIVPDSQQADVEVFGDTNRQLFTALTGGIRLNFKMDGVTQVVLESVDGYAIAGTANLITKDGQTSIGEISDAKSIITFSAPNGGTLQSGKDYYITTFPCNLYGGYRLSIYRNGLVAHYFGVHQTTETGSFIAPLDLDESDFTYAAGQDCYPVCNITYADAVGYCDWLSTNDANHIYRLPSEEDWILIDFLQEVNHLRSMELQLLQPDAGKRESNFELRMFFAHLYECLQCRYVAPFCNVCN